MTTNPTTGLPDLPPGHFWRVRFGQYGYSKCYIIEIRRKLRFFPWASESVDYEPIYGGFPATSIKLSKNLTPERIKYAADSLLRTYSEREAQKATQKAEEIERQRSPLLGDYPPKSLNSKDKE